MILHKSENFKPVPWKNGKGITTELAISESGSIDTFEWRISIAEMNETMLFSKFENYHRDLILLEGSQLYLKAGTHINELNNTLSHHSFSGNLEIEGILKNGPVKNFNIITNNTCFETEVFTFTNDETVHIKKASICFIYSAYNEMNLYNEQTFQVNQIEPNTLIELNDVNSSNYTVRSKNFIITYLYGK